MFSMPHTDKTILVFGATGRQGGGVAKKLLADGWKVHAVSRHPDKRPALELKEKGATIVQADMADYQSLLKAMQGVYGVYSVQPLYTNNPEIEIKHGKAIADAAQQANISHFIYGSVSGAERDSGIPHFEKKWEIEKYVRSIDLPFTIIRPSFFMENFKNFTYQQNQKLILQGFIKQHIKLKMVSVHDIGSFVSIALHEPENYKQKAVNIAGDEMNLRQTAEAFRHYFKVRCDIDSSVREDFQKNKMFQWYESDGYQADIPKLRHIYPSLLDLPSWLETSNWYPFS